MKTQHNINIAEYLKKKPSEFVRGFLNACYFGPPVSGMLNRQDYFEGYADGAQYTNEIEGRAVSCLLRKV